MINLDLVLFKEVKDELSWLIKDDAAFSICFCRSCFSCPFQVKNFTHVTRPLLLKNFSANIKSLT